MILTIARFIRLPNTFTSAADVLAGFFILAGLQKHFSSEVFLSAILLAIASAAIYANGIIWNDIFDLATDKRLRPERPLPSGKITMVQAMILSMVLTFVSVIICLTQSLTALYLSGIILCSAWLYDALLKHSEIGGSIAMAICRSCNLSLGFCAYSFFTFHSDDPAMPNILFYPATHFIYIFTLTYLGTMQEGKIQIGKLIFALLSLSLLIFWLFFFLVELPFTAKFLLSIIYLAGMMRIIKIFQFKQLKDVGLTIKYGVLFLIPIDALLSTSGSTDLVGVLPALAVLSLMIPAFWSAKFIEVT